MKQTTITKGIYSWSVSPLKSDTLQSQGKVQQNKMYLFTLYPKAKAMKTILTLLVAFFLQVTAFSQVSSLTGNLNNNRVDLKWTTSSEKNLSHFIIEKSIDGKNYSQAGIVFAFGNTAETMTYPFFEKNIKTNQEGVIYYRVNSVTNDGKIEFSQVTAIGIGKKSEK